MLLLPLMLMMKMQVLLLENLTSPVLGSQQQQHVVATTRSFQLQLHGHDQRVQ